MAKRTKKVGSAGRFGARYGVRIRKRIADVERVSKIWHECPKCMAAAVKRQANGIWVCRHCGAQLASSSYVLTAPVAVKREVSEAIAAAKAKVEGPKETEKTPEPAEEELKER